MCVDGMIHVTCEGVQVVMAWESLRLERGLPAMKETEPEFSDLLESHIDPRKETHVAFEQEMASDEAILEDIQEVNSSSSSLTLLSKTIFQSEITQENGEVYLFQYLSLLEKQLTTVSLVSQVPTFLTPPYDIFGRKPSSQNNHL